MATQKEIQKKIDKLEEAIELLLKDYLPIIDGQRSMTSEEEINLKFLAPALQFRQEELDKLKNMLSKEG